MRASQTLNIPASHASSTAPTSPQAPGTGAQQQINAVNMSPKHHRPLPTASAPPSIPQYQAGKTPFSVHNSSSAASSVNSDHSSQLPQQSNMSSSHHVNSASSNQGAPAHSQTPSSVVVGSLSQMSADSSGGSSVTASSSSTPQEYSLFNDSFTKVTQQSMWGRENDSHKAINFAAVTGGMSNQPSVIAPPKFIDNDPPQLADASKAPGYRGTAVCSPVSSKTSSNSTTPPSMPLTGGTSYHNFPDQQKTQSIVPLSGMNLNRPVSRPGVLDMSQTSPLDHIIPRGPPVYSTELPVRSSAHAHSQDSNLYKNVTSNFTADTSNLLKMVPGPGNDVQQQHGMMFHQQGGMQHHLNFSQPQPSSGQMSNNPTVSMSRLNPRAPDFSLHNIAASKQQSQQPPVNMFNSNYHHAVNQNSGGPNNQVPYPMKSSLNTYAARNQNQNRNWQFMGPPSGYMPQQQQNPDMMVQQMGHLRGMGMSHPPMGSMDLLENGGMNPVSNSPAMSPNSPSGLGQVNAPGDGHHKMEDRKIPQPIGIERAWKIHNNSVPADAPDINWLLGNESKMAMGAWATNCLGPNMERQQPQMFRSSFRMPTGDEITHMMDTYQVSFILIYYSIVIVSLL